MVPERLFGRLVAVGGAVALLAVAWFALARPAIRDAAEKAVNDQQPAPVSTISGDNSGDSSDNSTPIVVSSTLPLIDNTGRPILIPLAMVVPQGQAAEQRYAVPAGQHLQVTDLIVQNPNADQGTLTIQRNDVVLFTYRLDNIFTDVGIPLVTPIEFLTGEDLVVVVTCVGVGDQTLGSCAPQVIASGLLLNN
jgi:hypothetical protein